jgi:hypothetical protein
MSAAVRTSDADDRARLLLTRLLRVADILARQPDPPAPACAQPENGPQNLPAHDLGYCQTQDASGIP